MAARWLIPQFRRSQVGNSAGKMLPIQAHLMILLGRYRQMTGQLIPRSGVHVKLRVTWLSKIFPAFCLLYCQQEPATGPCLDQMNPADTLTLCFNVLTSTSRSRNGIYPSETSNEFLITSFFFSLSNSGIVAVNSPRPQSPQLVSRNPAIRRHVT